jgi:hypothetical protein
MKMEATGSSETSVDFQQTTQRCTREDRTLQAMTKQFVPRKKYQKTEEEWKRVTDEAGIG